MATTPESGGAKEARASFRLVAASMTAYCWPAATQRASLNGRLLKTEPGDGAAGAGAYGSESICQPARSTLGWTVKLKLWVRGRPVRAPAAVTVIECAPAPTGTRAVSCREPELDWIEAVAALPSTASETPLEAALTRRPRIEVEVVSTG